MNERERLDRALAAARGSAFWRHKHTGLMRRFHDAPKRGAWEYVKAAFTPSDIARLRRALGDGST